MLRTYVERFGVEPRFRQPFFAAVNTMKSDYEKRRLASAVDASNRQAFTATAERIRSTHEQNRVLAALVRSDRR